MHAGFQIGDRCGRICLLTSSWIQLKTLCSWLEYVNEKLFADYVKSKFEAKVQ